jgi:hypothetical protein
LFKLAIDKSLRKISKIVDTATKRVLARSLRSLALPCGLTPHPLQPAVVLVEEDIVAPDDVYSFPISRTTTYNKDVLDNVDPWIEILISLTQVQDDETAAYAVQALSRLWGTTRDEGILQQWLVAMVLSLSSLCPPEKKKELHNHLARTSGKLWYQFGLWVRKVDFNI